MKLSLVLKEKTENAHLQLEKVLVKKLKSISTVDDYIDVLKDFYGYVKPLEDSISENIDIAVLPDYALRRKAGALTADISHFKTDSQIQLSKDVPAIRNGFEALGALYVLEGSTLGGQIISKMITQKIQISETGGLSFFQSYGAETHSMWNNFKERLDECVPEGERENVVRVAEQTFTKFKTWLNDK